MIGSWMKKFTLSVFDFRNGSRYAVVGSGNSDMSDSLIAWKPRIDEPSKPRPSSNTDWSNDDTGTVKCCMMPGRSQKRTSTISTPSSLMNLSSSSLLLNIRFLLDGDQRTSRLQRHGTGPRCTVRVTLASGSF